MKTVKPYFNNNIKSNKIKDKLRVAAYCRVSTGADRQESSLELQKSYYDYFIEQHPNWINAGIFAETKSGLNMEYRSEFQNLLNICREGKVDMIITKSISRFGRNTLEILKTIQELQKLGVEVWFEKENIKTNQKHLNMLITVYAAYAQAESQNTSENIKWGLHHGFADGTSGMANFKCFGYTLDKNHEIIIKEDEAAVVKEIFKMREHGKSLNYISQWLYDNNIKTPSGRERWSRETLNKMLRNEKYTGNVLLQKTFVKDLFDGKQVKNQGQKVRYFYRNHHPAIIDIELYKKINKEYAEQLFNDLESAQ